MAWHGMIETAKANQVEPYSYLKTLYSPLQQAETLEDIEGLLPWNV
jgi:transposase